MKVNKDWNKKAGVYKITFRNECYIGSSKNLYGRLSQHISHLRANKHHSRYMQRCYNKYGESEFVIEILETIEYNEETLRQKELSYINLYKSKFNSTTPITYHHSSEMKEKISKTLKQKYINKQIRNPRLDAGSKVFVYNFKGELLLDNVLVKEVIKVLNISNRSVVNNNLRVGRPISKKQYLILPEKDKFQFLCDWIEKQKGRKIPMYQVFEDGSILRCTSSSQNRVIEKVLTSKNYLYYSKRNKSYYTFIGNIIKCPFYK